MTAYVGRFGRFAKPPRTVVAAVALVALGSVLAFSASLLLANSLPQLSRDLRVALGYIPLVIPLAIAYRNRSELFGFRRERLGVAVATGLVLALMTLLAFGKGNVVATGLSAHQTNALLVFTLVGLVEEGIFRGVLQTQLASWLGPWLGLFAGVVLFSIWHIPQRLLAGLSGVDLAGSLVPVVALGVVLGLFMLVVRNTTGPAILHTAVNWVERI